MIKSLLHHLVARYRANRRLSRIMRDANRRYPYPWDEAARMRYVTERHFIESIDCRQVVDLLRNRKGRAGR